MRVERAFEVKMPEVSIIKMPLLLGFKMGELATNQHVQKKHILLLSHQQMSHNPVIQDRIRKVRKSRLLLIRKLRIQFFLL